jgi:DNA-binding IclR family transcriptional regulator
MEQRSGAQSIERAFEILRAVADAGSTGMRLSDVLDVVDLNKATVHRMLGALTREGMLDFDADSRRYFMGIEALMLGAVAAERHGIQRLAAPYLRAIADATGDTVYLMVRRNYYGVCLARDEGAYPIRTLTLNVGDRLPLGVGSGCLAMLACLPKDEINSIIEYHGDLSSKFGPWYTQEKIREQVMNFKKRGYALLPGIMVSGMTGIALPILGPGGVIMGAISVAAINERMTEERRPEIVSVLRHQIGELEKLFDGGRQRNGR